LGIRSADFIRASGHAPRKQVGRTEAPDQLSSTSNSRAAKGPSTHDGRELHQPRREPRKVAVPPLEALEYNARCGERRHPSGETRQQSSLVLVAAIVGASAAQIGGRGSGQQDGPNGVGLDDEWRGLADAHSTQIGLTCSLVLGCRKG